MASAQPSSPLTGSNASPIGSSLEWMNDLLLGQVAVGLCVMAVAIVGFLMLTGRWPLRLGSRVILGCFVLLGAPAIASALISSGRDTGEALPPQPIAAEQSPRGELPPADYSPYGQASVRDEGQ